MTYTAVIWHRVEITLRSQQAHEHPDTDVAVWAEFVGPSGSTISLPGFWDGGDVWKVRFAPTEVGSWSYEITSNTDLQESGVVVATPYTGDIELYRRGFVGVNARAFEYADGAPFFWLGNTHWQAPNYERLDVSNHPTHPGTSQFRITADRDRARGFTVYQTYPDAALNDGGGNVSQVNWWTENYTHLDPQAFRDQFDVMMDYLADHGTVIALGLGVHTQTGLIGAEALSHFAKYVTARYAAHPVVWITGQEVDIENEHASLETWRAAARTITANDGYHHPLGAHMNAPGEPKTFGEELWHDWFPTQGGHEGIRSQAHYESYWNFTPRKPFLETEANYEGIWSVPPDAPRQSAWKALLCGSYGYTYGVAGVWAIKWDYEVAGWDDYQNGVPWFDGLDKPGGDQMTILKEFFLGLADWQALVPRFGDRAFGEFAQPEESVLASSAGGTCVVYFYGASRATGTLTGLVGDGSYSARWFNPRSGSSMLIADRVVASPSGTWEAPQKPDEHDWVLHLEMVGSAEPSIKGTR